MEGVIPAGAGQTFQDWEIVAVDDASPDGTHAKLLAWASREPRVRVDRNPSNRGVTGNWNECLRRARGEFVVKLDADDVYRPRTLEELIAPMADRGVVGSGVRALVCSEDLQPIGSYPSDAAMSDAGIDPYADSVRNCAEWLRIAAWGHQLWNGDAILVRRAVMDQIGGLDERFGCASDTALVVSVLSQPGLFSHRAYVGVYYRTVGSSISHDSRRDGSLALEGTVLQLMTLARLRQRERLPRALRMHHVQFWRRWRRVAANPSPHGEIPAGVVEGLRRVMKGVAPPPLSDRASERLRNLLSRLPV
ncbi:MAG: glycosyltransferase family 2 protein [Thermoanaerobaculia bacterium]